MPPTGRLVTDIVTAAPAADPATLLFFGALAIVAYAVTVRRLSFALPMLLVLDPFDVARYAGHTTITTFKVALVGICIALVQRRALAAVRTPAARATLVCLLALIAANALTLFVASFHAPAVRETLKAIEYLTIFFVALCVVRTEPGAIRATSLTAAAVVVAVAAAALLDFAHPQSLIQIGGHAYARIAGALEGPNQLAAWLGIMLPVAASAAASALPVAIGIGTALLALTLSRGGSAQTLGALVTLAIGSRTSRWVAPTALLGFCAGLGGLAIIDGSGTVVAHFLSIVSSVDEGGTGSRDILWHAALAMFRSHPLLGVGAGNFELLLPAYGAPPQVRTQANSLYLEALADGGIVLATVTVAAAWLPPVMFLRAGRTTFALAVGIGGIALALHGFIDDVTFYTKVGQCWWLVAGAAAGSIEVAGSSPAEPPPQD